MLFDFFMRWGSEHKKTIHILIRDDMLKALGRKISNS